MTKIQTIKLKVTGERTLHCAGCERSVEFTLTRLPGVEDVQADHQKQSIEMTLDSSEGDLEKIKAELAWIGYEADLE